MDSFERVYELYFKDVYRYILSLCQNAAQAEEITQETFFQALKHMPSFRGNCKMTVWLCQIAKHLYFADQKKQKRRQDTTAQNSVENSPQPDSAPSLELLICREAESMKIHELLHRLEEPYKEVFMLRVFGELSFKKIAQIFEKTENWARVTYHRAKLKIICRMEADNEKNKL